ncbi:MAG: response regulator [Chloroflexota bacterium]|nr:response regulator [Chloroflexota bacterium]
MDDSGQPRCQILIVEDDAMIGTLERDLLSQAGYEPLWVTQGQAALDLLHAAAAVPDLIILDLMLPDMPGQDLYAALEADERWRTIPVLIISALPAAAAHTTALTRATYLPKPFDPPHLLALVRTTLADCTRGREPT